MKIWYRFQWGMYSTGEWIDKLMVKTFTRGGLQESKSIEIVLFSIIFLWIPFHLVIFPSVWIIREWSIALQFISLAVFPTLIFVVRYFNKKMKAIEEKF